MRRLATVGLEADMIKAFKRINAQHPLYGNHSQPPLKPEEWWTKVIHQTILHAGASTSGMSRAVKKCVVLKSQRWTLRLTYLRQDC